MGKRLLLFVFFYSMTTISNGQEYSVKARSEIYQILELRSDQIDTTYQIENNNAFVTIFKDKTGVIYTTSIEANEGIYFNDLKFVQKMIDSGVYPVKGDGSFWETQKDKLYDFPKLVDESIKKLSKTFEFDFKLQSDKEYLENLSQVLIQKIKGKKVKKELYYYLAIYLGELKRLEIDGEYRFFPNYNLNVYFYPELFVNNTSCSYIGTIIGRLEIIKYKDISVRELLDDLNFSPAGKRDLRKL